MIKLSFYLMGELGYNVLRRIILVNRDIISRVVFGTDRNVKNDYSVEIATICKDNNLACYARGHEPQITVSDYVLAISWRWMIEHESHRLVIFHDSLLPKYRGFSPLVNMLINGERKIGVSAILGTREYDRGDIIAQQHASIAYPIKVAEAIQINSQIYADIAEIIVNRIACSEELTGTPQVEAEASYSIWRNHDDYFIDWQQSASQIRRFIDAVGAPYLGARSVTSCGDEVVIEDAEEVEDVHCELRHVGKVLFVDQGIPVVICGKGLLRIKKASLATIDGLVDYLPIKKFRTRFQ